MSTRHRKFSVSLLFIIPLLVLCSLAIPYITTIQNGTDVYLQTEPMQEGDAGENYIVLRYEVEKVPKMKMTERLVKTLKEPSDIGKTKVYGMLEEKDGIHHLAALSDQEPKAGIYLSGWLPQTIDREFEQADYYYVDFGLDRFEVLEKGRRAAADSPVDSVKTAHFKVLGGNSILRKVEMK